MVAKKLSQEDQMEELQLPAVIKEEIGSASSTYARIYAKDQPGGGVCDSEASKDSVEADINGKMHGDAITTKDDADAYGDSKVYRDATTKDCAEVRE